MSSGKDPILFDVAANGVATLTLNRPEKYNAFTREMILAWHAALQRAQEDREVRVVVLTGAGKAFCAGGDVGAQSKRIETSAIEQKDFLFRLVHRIALEMEKFDKPVIAAINGVAMGAGLDMALMCDIRVMCETAKVAESYINVGLIAGDGGTWYLPRIVGMQKALELCWTGRQVAAQEALRIGLVAHVAPAGTSVTIAQELAATIAVQPPDAVQLYKRAMRQGMSMNLETHLDMVSSHMSLLRATSEHKERVAAFLARKRPTSSVD